MSVSSPDSLKRSFIQIFASRSCYGFAQFIVPQDLPVLVAETKQNIGE